MDATVPFFDPASRGFHHGGPYSAQHGQVPALGYSGPHVQHFRSVDDFLVAFTAYAVATRRVTPSDISDGRSLGATLRLSPAALAGLPVNLWRPSDWLGCRSYALVAGDRDTAAAHSLSLLQLPTEVARAAASLDTSFLTTAPAPDSALAAKPAPDPDSDTPESDSDDRAEPKEDAPGAAREPLPDAALLAALKSDAPRVEELRRHLLDRGLPTVGLKGELVGRLFEHLLAPPAPSPAARPSGGAPSARSVVDSVTLQHHASALTTRLAGGASAFPRLLSKLYPVGDGSSDAPRSTPASSTAWSSRK